MKEIIDFSEMGELERLEYIEKELNKEKSNARCRTKVIKIFKLKAETIYKREKNPSQKTKGI